MDNTTYRPTITPAPTLGMEYGVKRNGADNHSLIAMFSFYVDARDFSRSLNGDPANMAHGTHYIVMPLTDAAATEMWKG